MSRFPHLALGFTLTALLATATPAAGDPIQITAGVIAVGGVQDAMSRGFLRAISYDITTDLFELSGNESDGDRQQVLFPSLPRVGSWSSAEGSTDVFIDFGTMTVTSTPAVMPTPFFLTGRLRVVDMSTGETLFDDTVFGHGTASWMWVTSPFGGDDILSGARYEFSDAAPVPEPATLLLLGSGLAGLVARRRRLRS